MFGPRMEIEGWDYSLVLRDITGEDLQAPVPDPEAMRYLSPRTHIAISDLLIYGDDSDLYKQMEDDPGEITWGLHVADAEGEKCTGFTVLYEVPIPENAPAGWREAESAAMLFWQKDMGQGIATRSHPYRTCFGLGMGLDRISTTVTVGNERSRRALLRAGYVLLGEMVATDGSLRHDMALYNPALGDAAVEHAMTFAGKYENAALTPEMVRASQAHVHNIQQELPQVGELAARSAAQTGSTIAQAAA